MFLNKTILICAVDESGGFSKNGYIPWNYPEDRKFFKQLVVGNNAVICGVKTFDVFQNIKSIKNFPNFYKVGRGFYSPVSAYETAFYDPKINKIIIAGGQDVFNDLWINADILFITHVKGDSGCDRKINFLDKLEKYNKVVLLENENYKRTMYYR